jgi:predicted transcriptional regulator
MRTARARQAFDVEPALNAIYRKDCPLTWRARLVVVMLIITADGRGRCRLTVGEIAGGTALCERAVRKYLAEAVEKKHVLRVIAGYSVTYQLTLPEIGGSDGQ